MLDASIVIIVLLSSRLLFTIEIVVFPTLNDLNFVDQVQYFNNADYIIGLHGAGFANLSFCKNNTKVIEFTMPKIGKMYENIANKNNLQYNSIISHPDSHDQGKQLGHIEIPLSILEQKLNDTLKS